MANESEAPEEYHDPGIEVNHAPIPRSLRIFYVFIVLWGLASYYLYFNGSHGWLDRGYWKELEIAANTTFPFTNEDAPKLPEQQLRQDEKNPYP